MYLYGLKSAIIFDNENSTVHSRFASPPPFQHHQTSLSLSRMSSEILPDLAQACLLRNAIIFILNPLLRILRSLNIQRHLHWPHTRGLKHGINFLKRESICLREDEVRSDQLTEIVNNIDGPDLVPKLVDTDRDAVGLNHTADSLQEGEQTKSFGSQW